MTADPYSPDELPGVIEELSLVVTDPVSFVPPTVMAISPDIIREWQKKTLLEGLSRLLATVEAMAGDAARYQFMKQCAVLDSEGWWAFETPIEFPGQEFNEAIDAARKGQP